LIEILTQELKQAVEEQQTIQSRSEEFRLQSEAETQRKEEAEQRYQEWERQLASGKQEQVQIQNRVSESRIQIAELKERDRSLLAEIERLETQCRNIELSIQENEHSIIEKKTEIEGATILCSEMETRQLENLRKRDEQKVQLQQQEQFRLQIQEELSQQSNAMEDARGLMDQAREGRRNCEVEKIRVETQKEDLLTRGREEMGIELESLVMPDSAFNQLPDDEMKAKLTETELKIERLGSINMLALEEYTQMEERHRFLNVQYQDLKLSIDTLLETIQRIDATSLQRFRDAFAAVQSHFHDLFQRLFNGGKCEMVLTDPENPGESGIDIHVQPPGKRLQNMNLLSGGEKTLTGIAFLMALFQYHASPFCVMDEVDAALDEINIQRFAALISEMKKKIQFVIVTHNKRTMEAADQLYGITMGEPGVSSILSAKFEEAEALVN
jgi:chromosome segregation protein